MIKLFSGLLARRSIRKLNKLHELRIAEHQAKMREQDNQKAREYLKEKGL